MAISLISKYKSYYKDLSTDMTEENSVYDKMLKRMLEEFTNLTLDPEQQGALVADTVLKLIPQFEQLLDTKVRELVKLESEIPKIEAEIPKIKAEEEEIIRKKKYYDDRLFESVMNKQADLASFAVNADSDQAQSTIDDLKVKMTTLEGRSDT